jgi:addiction module HigA family antidote
VLEDYLATRGMTQAELALRCGRPTKTISEIVNGKAAITPETALQLGRVFDRPAALWQNLESNYRLQLAQKDERERFAKQATWAKGFPVRELVKRRCIEKPLDDAGLVRNLLQFFGVGSVEGWEGHFGELQIAYRRSARFEATRASVLAWIRLGELAAERVECRAFERGAFQAVLTTARKLTTLSFPDARDELVGTCATAGVAVVFVPELPKTHLSGVARWLSKDKALVQLSLRYKRSDHLWFTFFHEAGHVLLHSKKTTFIDEHGSDDTEIEREANQFASDYLIPASAFASFRSRADFSASAVEAFARAQGIAPGIVVGRLQHERVIPHSWHAGLCERLG